MDAATKSRVQVKIFIGFELKVDMRIRLKKNSRWKEANVSKSTLLKEVHYNEKDYIGTFLIHELMTMNGIQEIAGQVRNELQNFCTEDDLSSLKIQIFPQVFVI